MAEIIAVTKNNKTTTYLLNNERVFIPSKNIKIFPCSRRGQHSDPSTLEYYDPEARLNTERTNRIGTAINGFTDSFIEELSENGTLIFVLAGYRIEVKNFDADSIAEVLNLGGGILYAHLSLHTGISLNMADYATEILYRQSTDTDISQLNSLDVTYTDEDTADDFFVGVSFTKDAVTDTVENVLLPAYNLALFTRAFNHYHLPWNIVQTSMLPKVQHGETVNSVRIATLETDQLDITNDSESAVANIDVANIKVAQLNALTVNGLATIGGCTINADTNTISAGIVNAASLLQNNNPVPTIWMDESNNQHKLNITLGAADAGGGAPPSSSGFTIIDCGTIG